MTTRTVWLVTIPRIVLGGWMLLPVPITAQAMQFAGIIIKVGYLWPLMKAINLVAGVLLIANLAPAFAVALLLPITVIIVWFQVLLNPLPVPIGTCALAVTCELLLLRAYAGRYAGMFMNDAWSPRESMP